jgi:hypothetical protein
VGEILLVVIAVMVAGIVAAFAFGLVPDVKTPPVPAIGVLLPSENTVELTLHNKGGVITITSVKITSPINEDVDLQTIGDGDEEWDVGETITLIDSSLVPGARLVVVASLDGDDRVVLDMTL